MQCSKEIRYFDKMIHSKVNKVEIKKEPTFLATDSSREFTSSLILHSKKEISTPKLISKVRYVWNKSEILDGIGFRKAYIHCSTIENAMHKLIENDALDYLISNNKQIRIDYCMQTTKFSCNFAQMHL